MYNVPQIKGLKNMFSTIVGWYQAKQRLFTWLLLGIVTVLTFVDIMEDIKEGSPGPHVILEVIIFTFAFFGLIIQAFVHFNDQKQLATLAGEIKNLTEEKSKFLSQAKSYTEGLAKIIHEQLTNWQLSESEKDVAILLIKGLSMKEIAVIRQTQEATVRQQATNIYKKSNTSGRQELAAFFLEDLF